MQLALLNNRKTYKNVSLGGRGEGSENCQRMALILEYWEEFHVAANIISLKLHENIIYLNSYKSLLVKRTVSAGILMNKNEV